MVILAMCFPVDDFCNITKTINNSKQCDHVWKVRPHPTLVVCSRPRIAGHDTSVPAVSSHPLKPEELKIKSVRL